MLKESELMFYTHCLKSRNRVMQQYHAAYTGKNKIKAMIRQQENFKKQKGVTISC
ncbi:MAG: hypothetical protein GX892_09760 [Thermoanaerobacteraceae bacterium]|nr:hypothetical protein [Thermoanaerobacteraceae bacterium]